MSVALVQRTSWFNVDNDITSGHASGNLPKYNHHQNFWLLMTTPHYILYNHVVSCERTVFLTVFLLLQDHVPDANLSVLLQTVYPPNLLEAREMFQDALKV